MLRLARIVAVAAVLLASVAAASSPGVQARFGARVAINPPANATGQGNASANFTWPGGLTLDARGNVYVADARNSRIVKLAPDGTVLMTVPLDLHHGAQLTEPVDVAVDRGGSMYIVFWLNGGVVKLAPDGTQLARFDRRHAFTGV
jgi:hypothetical protein